MHDIDALQAKTAALYQQPRRTFAESLQIISLAYVVYAEQYLDAAAVLDDANQPLRHTMPWYQLIGQALELAMKACLAVAGVEPPRTHDLVRLCKQVEAEGFDLAVEHMHAFIVHLNHGYYEDLATGDRFASRYGGGGTWVVPDHARLAESIKALIVQVRARSALPHD